MHYLLIRFLPPLKREVGCRKASRRDFFGVVRNLNRLCATFLIRFLPPLKREVGCRRQLGGISWGVIWSLNRECATFLIPQSARKLASSSLYKGAIKSLSHLRCQLLTGESPLCHFVTFPHTVGNHPIWGSLKALCFLPENTAKNVQNRVQYLSKSSKLKNVNNLFIILQQHCQFYLPLLPKNNNSICSIQKINKFVWTIYWLFLFEILYFN